MKLVLLLLLLLICLGAFEMSRHAFHRRRIRIRIHVNGSRGKSSVTRLIAAGLRAGGIRTVAKTTGSAARIIHTDGSESPVRRRGGPNIREQLGIFRAAVRERAQALVLECMAIRPDLQKVSEHKIVKATHGVITNVRPDHLEVMGPTMDDIAANLAVSVPRRGHLFTAETTFADFLARRARKQGSNFTQTRPEEITKEDLAGFRYIEFPENVSLALDVCKAAGVQRESALAGMYLVEPDVGALTLWFLREGDKVFEFINAFAANDAISYVRIWERLSLAARQDHAVLLMNIRSDRQRRSKDLAPLFGRELVASHYVLIGEETRLFAEMLRRRGLPRDRILDLGGWPAVRIWDRLVALCPNGATVVGMGNIAGVGHDFLELLRAKEVQE